MEKTLTIQTPKSLKNRLEQGADEEMTSQASIVRRALDEYLPEGEDSNGN
jgi:predicted DNA-binding protein